MYTRTKNFVISKINYLAIYDVPETRLLFEASLSAYERSGRYQIVKEKNGVYSLYKDDEWILSHFAPDNIFAELSRLNAIDFIDTDGSV